jgi:hypothetical protein
MVVLALSGCGADKYAGVLTKENVGKLKGDMTRAEVESILGKGTEVPEARPKGEPGTAVNWGDADRNVLIYFNQQGKLTGLNTDGIPKQNLRGNDPGANGKTG